MKREQKKRLLAATLAAFLISTGNISYTVASENITPNGETNTTVTTVATGADLVDIADPNAAGISGNRYLDFNVGEKGTILSNTLTSTDTTLAGRIQKNPHLTRPADLIINEVTSSRNTFMRGLLEVGGKTADVMIANPNGISVYGGGFLNVGRATLTTGLPDYKNGDATQGLLGVRVEKGAISVHGDFDARGAKGLDILSKAIHVNAKLHANELNMVTGQNKISADLKTIEKIGTETGVSLDTSAIGGMYANKIRLVGTADGLGVNNRGTIEAEHLALNQAGDIETTGTMKANTFQAKTNAAFRARANDDDGTLKSAVLAGDTLAIDAKNIDLKGTELSGKNTLRLHAKEQLAITGDIRTSNAQQESTETSRGVKTTTTQKSSKDRYLASTVSGGAMNVAGKDIHMSGTALTADDFTARAENNFTADADRTKSLTESKERSSKMKWWNEKTTETSETALHTNTWKVKNRTAIAAKDGDLRLTASDVTSNNIALTAGKNLVLSGDTSSKHTKTSTDMHLESAWLKSGNHTVSSDTEEMHTTKLRATNTMHLKAQDAAVSASDISAKLISLDANSAHFNAQTSNNSKKDLENYTYWWKVAGSDARHNTSEDSTSHVANLHADTLLLNAKDAMTFQGTQAEASTLKVNAGNLTLTGAENIAKTSKGMRHGTAFNITNKKSMEDTEKHNVLQSSFRAKNNLELSATEMALMGAKINAGNHLALSADHLTITSLNDCTKNAAESFTLGFKGEWNLDKKALKGNAGLKYQGVTTLTTREKETAHRAELAGQNIDIKVKDAMLSGADVTAKEKLSVKGANLTFGADKSVTSETLSKGTTGAEAYIAGEISKIKLGLGFGTEQVRKRNENSVANTVSLTGNNISVNSDGILKQIGTQLKATDDISLHANAIENLAAKDVSFERIVSGNGGISAELGVNTSKLFSLDTRLRGEGGRVEDEKSTAKTTSMTAKNVKLSADSVKDVGTAYKADGALAIQTKIYDGKAAENLHRTTKVAGKAALDLGLKTATMTDLTANAGISGSYQYEGEENSTAVLGTLEGKSVDVSADFLTTSANIKGETVKLKGQNVTLAQAEDRTEKKGYGFDAKLGGGLTVTLATGAVAAPNGSLGAGGNYAYRADRTARTADIQGKNVQITADNALQVNGTAIRADENLSLKGTDVSIRAARNTHNALEVKLGGSIGVSFDVTEGGGSGNGSFDVGFLKESSDTRSGRIFTGKNITIEAKNTLKTEGLSAEATTLNLRAGNAEILAAESTKNKVLVSANAGMGGKRKTKKVALDKAIHSGLNVEYVGNKTYELGKLRATEDASITADTKLTLQSNLDANRADLKADSITIRSAQNKIYEVGTEAAFNLAGSPAKLTEDTSASTLFKLLKDDYQKDTIFGLAVGKNGAGVSFKNENKTIAASIDAKELNLMSKDVLSESAHLRRSSGTGTVTKQANYIDHHYGFKFGLNFSGIHPKDIVSNLMSGKYLKEGFKEFPIKYEFDTTWEKNHEVKSDLHL